MNIDFSYLNEKIKNADILKEPFPHIYIDNFFEAEHFASITNSPEICIPKQNNDEELIDSLFQEGYKIVPFPGATTQVDEYISVRKKKGVVSDTRNTCEASGMVLRLNESKSEIITALKHFLGSHDFFETMAQKFGIQMSKCTSDTGIQKYLDGYEISPHPDIRKKALTFMVNINPCSEAEQECIHTQYLSFSPEYEYVTNYWSKNNNVERNWVPWNWCKPVKTQTINNSIVIFSPSEHTLHAVKANYDHLKFQRTQLYGNLWFDEGFVPPSLSADWEDLIISPGQSKKKFGIKSKIHKFISRLRYGGFRNNSQVDKSRKDNY